MSLIAKDSGGQDFEPLSEGVHHAVCTRIYDLGTQHSDMYGTEAHKVLLTWEVPDETIEVEGENKPRIISQEYTLSLHKKAKLRGVLEAWRSKKFTEKELEGFNIEKLLGANCQIQVVHVKKDDKTYANIAAIMALPKGSEKKDAYNGTHSYMIENELNFPPDTPEWIQNKIKNCNEFKEKVLTGFGQDSDVEDIEDTDIPF